MAPRKVMHQNRQSEPSLLTTFYCFVAIRRLIQNSDNIVDLYVQLVIPSCSNLVPKELFQAFWVSCIRSASVDEHANTNNVIRNATNVFSSYKTLLWDMFVRQIWKLCINLASRYFEKGGWAKYRDRYFFQPVFFNREGFCRLMLIHLEALLKHFRAPAGLAKFIHSSAAFTQPCSSSLIDSTPRMLQKSA